MASSSNPTIEVEQEVPNQSSMVTLHSVPEVFLNLSFHFLLADFRIPSPPVFRSGIFLQELRKHIIIPLSDKPVVAFLGPMGDPDPTELINLETDRIPFRHASMKLSDWNNAF